MQTCGSQFGVFVEGRWQWYADYRTAARIEAEELYKKVQTKLVRGGTAILGGEQIGMYEAARSSAENTEAGQSAE